LTKGCLRTLHAQEWVNDQIIFCFTLLITEAYHQLLDRDTANSVHVFPSTFSQLLQLRDWQERIHNFSTRWKVNVLEYDRIIFVVNRDNTHWYTVTAFPSTKRISIADSLPYADKYGCFVSRLLEYLALEAEKWRVPFDKRYWKIDNAKCTQQTNGYDCGVHVCLQVLCLFFGFSMDYDEENMDDYRHYILQSLLQKHLQLPNEICVQCGSWMHDGQRTCGKCSLSVVT